MNSDSPHQPHEASTLRFLVLGVQRHWKALNGHPTPPQGTWEVRSLPSGLTAWGSSFEEAVERVQRTIDAAVAHAEEQGTSDVEWYLSEFGSMKEDDARRFAQGWNRIASKALPTHEHKRLNSSKREYGVLNPELCSA